MTSKEDDEIIEAMARAMWETTVIHFRGDWDAERIETKVKFFAFARAALSAYRTKVRT